MNKLLMLAAVALFALLPALPGQADQPAMPTGPITMEQTKRPVVFDHTVHVPQDCTACHELVPQHFPPLAVDNVQRCLACHHLVDGDFPTSANCSDCHTELNPRDKSALSYYNIAHGRDLADGYASCLSCHLDVIQTRPEKRQELTACAGSSCHPK